MAIYEARPPEEIILKQLSDAKSEEEKLKILRKSLLLAGRNVLRKLIWTIYEDRVDKLKTDILKANLMNMQVSLSHEESLTLMMIVWNMFGRYFDDKPLEACKEESYFDGSFFRLKP